MSLHYIQRASEPTKVSDRVRRFRVSDESVDRHGTQFMVDGWDTRDFESHGNIWWNHRSSEDELPIGKPVAVHRVTSPDGARSLEVDIEFAPADVSPKADQVLRAIDFGMVGMTSVGAIVHERAKLTKEEREAAGLPPGGDRFTRQELLEVSVVGIGSNRNAVKRQVEDLLREGRITPEDAREVGGLLEDAPPPPAEAPASESLEGAVRELTATMKEHARAIDAFARRTAPPAGDLRGADAPEADEPGTQGNRHDTGEVLSRLLAGLSDRVQEATERVKSAPTPKGSDRE